MEVLGLNDLHPGRLPASSFPKAADYYFCDKCEREITEHFHIGRAHVDTPIGPSRFRCNCGEVYQTGAVEWDELSIWQRHRRAGLILFSTRFLLPIVIVGITAYFGFSHQNYWLLEISAIAIIPSVVFAVFPLLSILEVFEIVRSIWRTRVANSPVGRGSRV
jgi:hypothetical protein